jgi:hypothetical protein
MNTKDIISLCLVVTTAATAVTVTLSADDPAQPLSSPTHNATRLDADAKTALPSSLRTILKQPPPVLSTTWSPSELGASTRRGHPHDVRALRTSTSGTRRAHGAHVRQTNTARPARSTRVPRPHTAPPVLNRPPAPPAPRVTHRVAPQPPPPSVAHRTATPPPPPPSMSFDDSG